MARLNRKYRATTDQSTKVRRTDWALYPPGSGQEDRANRGCPWAASILTMDLGEYANDDDQPGPYGFILSVCRSRGHGDRLAGVECVHASTGGFGSAGAIGSRHGSAGGLWGDCRPRPSGRGERVVVESGAGLRIPVADVAVPD